MIIISKIVSNMELKNLHELAGGLNIEGGLPAIDLLKTNPNGKWVNLILVLDRPLIDKVIFDDIFTNNPYPLLESAIDNLNENHFLAAYLMIIGYYLENGRRLFKIDNNKTFKISIHIHQEEKSMALVELLDSYIKRLWFDQEKHTSKKYIDISNSVFEFRTDTKNYINSRHNYDDSDLLISLSQCAGLDPNFEPGTLLMPHTFIPYDIDEKIIRTKDSYTVQNILSEHLDDVLEYQQISIDFINQNHKSSNPLKKHKSERFDINSFHLTNILQVNKLWNPIDGNEMVGVDSI